MCLATVQKESDNSLYSEKKVILKNGNEEVSE